MSVKPLYEFDEERRGRIIRSHLSFWGEGDGRVTGPVSGAFGEVYSIDFPHPPRVAAKCPKIRKFAGREEAKKAIEHVLYELEQAHKVFRVPWINRFSDLKLIHGWPFLFSQYHDGSLEDLIGNPLNWSVQDKLISLIQITRALRLAREREIESHQDLKPGNVFFDDVQRHGGPPKGTQWADCRLGIRFHVLVGDFGLANAFRDLGRNSGSRPYMAPEQYSKEPHQPGTPVLFDNFALGVIAYECLADGLHPLGVTTAAFWPWTKDIPRKWDRAKIWRDWAFAEDKVLPPTREPLPEGCSELVLAAQSGAGPQFALPVVPKHAGSRLSAQIPGLPCPR